MKRIILALCLALPAVVTAQTFTTIYTYPEGHGAYEGLIRGRDGWLYGVRTEGLYRLSTAGQFEHLTDQTAWLQHAAADGTLYGYANNAIVRFDPTTKVLSTVRQFEFYPSPNAPDPWHKVQERNGWLYGTTRVGVFRLRPDGSGYEELYRFNAAQGTPSHPILHPDGRIVLSTDLGLYQVDETAKTAKCLHTYPPAEFPSGAHLVLGADGQVYGLRNGRMLRIKGPDEGGGVEQLGVIDALAKLSFVAGLTVASDGYIYGPARDSSFTTYVVRFAPTGFGAAVYKASLSIPNHGVGMAEGPDGKLYWSSFPFAYSFTKPPRPNNRPPVVTDAKCLPVIVQAGETVSCSASVRDEMGAARGVVDADQLGRYGTKVRSLIGHSASFTVPADAVPGRYPVYLRAVDVGGAEVSTLMATVTVE